MTLIERHLHVCIYIIIHRERESVCVCYTLQATMVTAQLCSFDPQAHTSQELVNTSPGTTGLAQAPTKGLMINCLNFDSEESRNKPDCWIDFITFKRAQSVHSCYHLNPSNEQFMLSHILHHMILLPLSCQVVQESYLTTSVSNGLNLIYAPYHVAYLNCVVLSSLDLN